MRILAFALLFLMPALPAAAQTELAALQAKVAAHSRAQEQIHGGRLGIAVLDTKTGAKLSARGDERFALCSTFKILLAAAVLHRVEKGEESLDRKIGYGPEAIVTYSPITEARIESGAMTVGDLCAAAVEHSDNTAANLLLDAIGGPDSLTRFLRSLGDETTRLDRIEPHLNENLPGDERDTTTPIAMLSTLRALLLGDALSEPSKAQLVRWLVSSKTGKNRIRAGIDPLWTVGNKTGSGENGAVNDVAILWSNDRPEPYLIVVYYSESPSDFATREQVIAHATQAALAALSSQPAAPSVPSSGI